MANFLEKVSIYLTLQVVRFLAHFRKSLIFCILVLKKGGVAVGRVFSKRMFLFIYKISFGARKIIRLILIRFSYPLENRVLFFLGHRQIVHLFIFLLTILGIIYNLQFKTEEVQPHLEPILGSLAKEKEKLIEERLPFIIKNSSLSYEQIGLKSYSYLRKPAEKEISPELVLGKAAIVKPIIPLTLRGPKPRKEIEHYFVQVGDTLSTVAEKFGLSLSTILWTNNLSSHSIIRPGQKLTILPVDGLLYAVKEGDTLKKIAKEFQVELKEITKFNKLTLHSPLKLNKALIIPGGRPLTVPAPKAPTFLKRTLRPHLARFKRSHRFPWGQCTWYVAQRRFIPWGGHAKSWLVNAQRYGYKIGKKPAVGAIMVTKESWWGHVSYVEAASKNRITISEMNHRIPGVFTQRHFHPSDKRIVGYIY